MTGYRCFSKNFAFLSFGHKVASALEGLTLLMLRLLLSKAPERKRNGKTIKPCHIGIHWKSLAEYSQMSTHVSFFSFFLYHFVLAKLATSSIRVKIRAKTLIITIILFLLQVALKARSRWRSLLESGRIP